MKIFITRHGETEWNTRGIIQGHLDSPLTDNGIEGAYKLSKRLKQVDFDYIITSPLYRAYRTAEIIAEKNSAAIVKKDCLKEINCGEFQGNNFREIWMKFPDLKKQRELDAYNFSYPNGESFAQFYQRVIKGFNEIIDEYSDSNILIVGHGGTIKCLTTLITEQDSLKSWYNNVVANCSLTEVDYIMEKFNMVKYNDIAHL